MDLFKSKLKMIKKWTAVIVLPIFVWNCAETPPPLDQGGNSDFDEAQYQRADEIRGGRLYDKWWAEYNLSVPPTSDRNPIWAARATKPGTENDFYNKSANGAEWRCKECHGWDYKGQTGAYSLINNPDHFTGVDGLNKFADPEFTKEHIFGMIINGSVELNGTPDLAHQFLADNKLSLSDVYDLTKFINEIVRNNTATPVRGNADQGKLVFQSTQNPLRPSCNSANCHLSNLPQIIDVANNNPEEFFHKVRFGQPGTLMEGGLTITQAEDVRAFVAAGAIIDVPTSDFNQTTYDAQDRADVVKGGLLYDAWWKASATLTEPSSTETHPLWPAANTAITGSGTFRCKECHGWDYRGRDGAYKNGKHFTGIIGIVATNTTPMTQLNVEDVYTYLKTNTDHGFANSFFSDEEYYDLTKFIMTMRAEALAESASFNFINDTTKLAIGADNANGKTLFEGTDAKCSSCHGTDGKTLNFDSAGEEYVHNIAQENPWEFIHKIRFGQPGSSMGDLYSQSATVNAMQTSIDLLGYSQTSLAPNLKRAGLLYDKWWATDGVLDPTEPTTRNPIWAAIPQATQDTTQVSDSATWRCKECHGWDYLGVSGAYGDTNSKHYSGIRGFIPFSISRAKEVLVDAIANGTCLSPCTTEGHSYSQYLSTQDIDLLADFVLQLSTTTEYNAALNSTDTTTGQSIYTSDTPGHCEGCHGADGNSIPAVNISSVANSNPQEFIHKIRYGHPGSNMIPPTLGFLGLNIAEAGDVFAYVKTLGSDPGTDPTYENASMVRGGQLYDKWWKTMQANDSSVQAPTGINPFYDENNGTLPVLAAGKEDTSWRCKSCHAWNYKGVGYFSGTSSDTGADNLLYKIELRRAAFNQDEAQVRQHFFQWIKNGYNATTHQFGVATLNNPTPMTDQDIWDVVKFLLEGGLINTDTYILSSGVVIGTDPVNGEGLYNGSINNDVNCSLCHGVDGNTPPTTAQGGNGDPLDIFAIAAANDNPWEVVHKIRFGQPATPMPATEGIPELSNKDAYDILAYMQKRFEDRLTVQ